MIMPIKIKNEETAKALADSETAKTPEPEKANIKVEQPHIVHQKDKANEPSHPIHDEEKPISLLNRVRHRK